MSMRTTTLMLSAVVVCGSAQPALAQKLHAADPMLADDDRLVDVTQQPGEIELSDLYDRFSHIFHIFGEPPFPTFLEAQNVNTLDEVPDSSWFTNRHGQTRLSIDELAVASNLDGPPNPEETWTIFAGKSQGITPGFSIIDGQGDRYVIKFDPVGIPELLTAAEVIGTKIFYALGYHVPQNYVVRFDPDNFAIEPGTMVEDTWGDSVPLTEFRVARMIRRVAALPVKIAAAGCCSAHCGGVLCRSLRSGTGRPEPGPKVSLQLAGALPAALCPSHGRCSRAGHGQAQSPEDGRRRDVRPGGWWLPSLLHRCPLAGAPF